MITVYTKPACVQCEATKRMMDKLSIDYDTIDAPRGFDITIVTTARTNEEGKALLDAFGFPFKREGQQ